MTCAASMRMSSVDPWGSPDVGGWLRQSTRLELGVNGGARAKNGDARVDEGDVASEGELCRWISDNGVLELLEGCRGYLSHRHLTANADDSKRQSIIAFGLWISCTWLLRFDTQFIYKTMIIITIRITIIKHLSHSLAESTSLLPLASVRYFVR